MVKKRINKALNQLIQCFSQEKRNKYDRQKKTNSDWRYWWIW